MASSKYYIYVLYCADDTLYCGFTNDVARRFATHQSYRGAKYTRVHRRHPLRLIYQEEFASKHAAMSAEYHFKHLPRASKVRYLKEHGVSVSKYYRINHHQPI